ncbi:MAG: adenylate/guanylate cyclase domain-containing protein [Acidimicrobiia bacterium]|nr:adenylate/guanylate cyclase domain-containing protein [Acidimicrobiia bacterium]
MSVATRLALVALLVTLISLGVTAVAGLRRGNQLADSLIESRLATISASRGDEIERYVASVRTAIAALAASPGAVDAIERLGAAYDRLSTPSLTTTEVSDLSKYYVETVVPELQTVRGTQVGLSALLPTQPSAARLQAAYSVPRRGIGGQMSDPVLVVDAGDGSAYSEVHSTIHPTYGPIAFQSGLDDLFLVDARNNSIVYSVKKRVDFGTSLEVGPLSGSALANLITTIGDDPRPGSTQLVDFAPYAPIADRPLAFVASPVIEPGGGLVGYVVGALSTTAFDSILTADEQWTDLGDTGETYLAGQEGTMRTIARPFVEQRRAFLAEPDADSGTTSNLTDDQRRRMTATGTTALVQTVNRRVLAAASNGPGVTATVNYQGLDVVTSFRPLQIDGVDWVVFTDVGADESALPVEGYARDLLFAIAIFVVVVTFIVVRWAEKIIAPVRIIAGRLRVVRSGSVAADTELELPSTCPDEYLAMSHIIDDMLRQLDDRQADITARADERAALLRQFLPLAVAQRTEQGAGDVLDHVDDATVVVLALHGLGRLLDELDVPNVRQVLGHVVDELDALANDCGLERARVNGDGYVAVCGVTRPYLDHAQRSVAFALEGRRLVAELASELGNSIDISGGVDSGPVSVGLTGRGGLVYDAWGTAVSGASELARRSPPGAIMVSATVRSRLPDDVEVTTASNVDDAVVVSHTGVSSAAAPSEASP